MKKSSYIPCHFPKVVLSCYNAYQVLQGPPQKNLMAKIPKDILANRDILALKEGIQSLWTTLLYYPPS